MGIISIKALFLIELKVMATPEARNNLKALSKYLSKLCRQ